ncbi:MAG: ATP-dependent zinc metalloprotease FtsH [Armatimonadetes bacterium]|nr:ATP-dependent zinc metalloprotease FtsH [Armatimonadota bacterium]
MVLILITLMNFISSTPGFMSSGPKNLNITEFYQQVENKQVKSADWQGTKIQGELRDNSKYVVNAFDSGSDSGSSLQATMREYNVAVKILPPPMGGTILAALGYILMPLLLFGLIYFMVIRPAQSGGNQAMNFGRSKAKRAGENTPKVTFEDVAGIDEAKEELYEVVDFLRNTKKYSALGAKIPKGILLEGPPGVGKTHVARAVAGEAGVPFFHISGSDFVEMFVGVGASRVRDLFETAKAHRPCLIFIDEIDAVGRQRGAGVGGGHDEREQTLNQLLVEMDGFDPNSGVIMIAATNRPDVLDPALLRPGRFDRRITVDPPDVVGREKILEIHAKGKPLADEITLKKLAQRTPGFTGADLANSLNEAALLAARRNHSKIHQNDLEDALDRVIAGPERKSRVIDAKEREVIAYHEAGHAIIGELLEHCDPVHKVTILPRGMSLGSTWSLPEKDLHLVSKNELLDDICALLGGRLAEEIVYGEVWTGASNDLQRVTAIARAMITQFGMSDKLGTLAIGRRSSNPFLGRDYAEDRDYSEEVARMIDEEVRHIVDICYKRGHDLLMEHRQKLDDLVAALLERETLDRDEFLAVLAGEELPALDKKDQGTPAKIDAPPTESESKGKSVPPSGKLEPGTANG